MKQLTCNNKFLAGKADDSSELLLCYDQYNTFGVLKNYR